MLEHRARVLSSSSPRAGRQVSSQMAASGSPRADRPPSPRASFHSGPEPRRSSGGHVRLPDAPRPLKAEAEVRMYVPDSQGPERWKNARR